MSARSSDTIRHIAKALAAAQRELQNPQPRHDGQIRRELPSGLALIEPYRFASLGDGLALVRPILGRYGLSLIQATRLDTQTALLVLETRIIHESGEWILADYPVAGLPQSGTSAPRELGAALTYARRQSLFSLIGIAPQNDTDGVCGGDNRRGASNAALSTIGQDRGGEVADHSLEAPQRSIGGNRTTFEETSNQRGAKAGLEPSNLRRSEEALKIHLNELEGLSSSDDLRLWAIQRIKAVAALLPQDRERLNKAFQAKRRSYCPEGRPDGDDLRQPAAEAMAPLDTPLPIGPGGDKRGSASGKRSSRMEGRANSPLGESSGAMAPIVAAGRAQP